MFKKRKKALSAGGVAALTLAALLTAVTGNSAQADDLVTHHEFQVNCTAPPRDRRPDRVPEHAGRLARTQLRRQQPRRTPPPPSTVSTRPARARPPASTPTTCRRTGGRRCSAATPRSSADLASDHLLQVGHPATTRTVRALPAGIRFVVGSPTATLDQFRTSPGAVEGLECGDSSQNWDFPANCTAGTPAQHPLPGSELLGRRDLDSADHKSHMAYPVNAGLPGRPPGRRYRCWSSRSRSRPAGT